MRHIIFLFMTTAFLSCNNGPGKTPGSFERIDPAFNSLVDENAAIEIIADSCEWSEGPLWVPDHKMLLFSDVPLNTIYKWTEAKGKEIYLTPSFFRMYSSKLRASSSLKF